MAFEIKYSNQAESFLKKHPELKDIKKIFKEIAYDITKMKNYDIGKMEKLKDTYRLRKGSYRIIFQKRDTELILIIIKIGNRGDVYK